MTSDDHEGYSVLIETEGTHTEECCVLITENGSGEFDYEFFDIDVAYKASDDLFASPALNK